MKYKIKFHCKQPWQRQTRIECSPKILIPHDWHCSADFGTLSFSVSVWQLAMCNWHLLFVRFLWIFSLLSVLAHLLKVLFQETSVFSTARWMPCHSNFFVAHVEEPAFGKFRLKSYEDVLEVSESFFKHHTVFPLTLALSNIYDRATITQQQDFDPVV